jgi:hypothetical protein
MEYVPRNIFHIDHLRNTMKSKTLSRFRGHGGKQKTEGRLDIFAIDTVVFLIGHTAAIIHHAIEH